MKRDLAALESREFDLLVVGAGIYGACIARDAALRGLAVALVDKADFGAATSHNSYRLFHGGLRYLQKLDVPRLRESAREQQIWLNMAAHLARPQPFLMPSSGHGARGPQAMRLALLLYDHLVPRARDGARSMPSGRMIGASDCLGEMPWLDRQNVKGGMVWHDLQMLNADRLLLECLLDATSQGAVIANHVAADGLRSTSGASQRLVTGVLARDRLSGQALEIRARVTVNACGPGAFALPDLPDSTGHPAQRGLFRAMNVLVAKPPPSDMALALTSRRQSDALVPTSGGRLYFVMPWHGLSFFGTSNRLCSNAGEPDLDDEDWMEAFLEEINEACPVAGIRCHDIIYRHQGLLPTRSVQTQGEPVAADRPLLIDHGSRDGVGGLFTVQGVKYTTARSVAQTLVDRVVRASGMKAGPSLTATRPLPGARGLSAPADLDHEALRPDAGGAERCDVIRTYGSAWRDIERGLDAEGARAWVAARMRHAVRHEMAIRLDDLLVRRMGHLGRGLLCRWHVELGASIMADELGWATPTRLSQVKEIERLVERHTGRALAADPNPVPETPPMKESRA